MKPLLLALRIGLGTLFLYAAATKLPDMAAFAESVANYRLLPASMVSAAAVVVIGVELTAAALLIIGLWVRAAAVVVTVLLGVYVVALVLALARGIDLECGCFGGSGPATWLTVARDLGLVAWSGAVVLLSPWRRAAP
jgi:uncharacterized membrane protein YphA (DoxX/SURF4 family)